LRAIQFLDLSSLDEGDTAPKIGALCMQAARPGAGLPPVAAVCVLPNFVRAAAKMVAGTSVRVATVAGGFPDGRATLERRVAEIHAAIKSGAQEIDTVLSPTALDPGGETTAFDEIAASRETCGPEITLKVILETGSLLDADQVRRAADLAMRAGADFIKTSTGKISGGASLPAARAMMQAVKAYEQESGKRVGIKVSGGIRKADQALEYLALLDKELGEAWATPEHFRIGASVLLDDLVEALRL
jgi:deoxyribose-phosphate aldolase